LKFRCPECKQRLHVGNEWVGKKVKCPSCSNRIVVPEPASDMPLVCPTCGNELVAGDRVCKRCRSFVDKRKQIVMGMPKVEPGAQTTDVLPADDTDVKLATGRGKKPALAPEEVEALDEDIDAEEKEALTTEGPPEQPKNARKLIRVLVVVVVVIALLLLLKACL